jgi:adenine-specific DNA-methyltransferase
MPSEIQTSYDRLLTLLRDLFQFDRADLDFGIYRIMYQRRTEIGKFLDEDLLPQVREVLATLKDVERERLEQELAMSYETEALIGVPRGSSQKVKDLEARLAEGQSAVDREVTLARASGTVTFPANFTLVTVMNFCPNVC